MKQPKEPKKAIKYGLTRHLIVKGLTFNAENPEDPVVLRPIKVDELVSAIVEYIEEGELPLRLAK